MSGQETVFRGIPVSSGVCHGPVIVVGPNTFTVPEYEVSKTGIPAEIQRFKLALIKTREELQKIQRELFDKVQTNEAGIFDAHLLVLEDQTIIDEVTRLVSDDRMNVEAAFDRITRKFTSALSAVEDNYLRERAADMKDVADRVMGNLLGGRKVDPLSGISEPSIIIGHDLSPSTTAVFDREMVLGFATDIGSPTSHTAILARSLNLPSVVALRDVSSRLVSGQQVLLDGYEGRVILNPSEQTLYQYGEVVRQHADFESELETIRDFPSETLDRSRVHLMTNIDHPDEVNDVKRVGADGVGLFRTEYLFLNRSEIPDEEQQFEAYRSAAVQLEGGALLIRTLDLGADKMAKSIPDLHEANPALGLRAIRFCLQHPVMFKQQLRAILRASAFGSVQLMYPMISNLDELLAANKLLEECRNELRGESVSFDEAMLVGIMIETPAAAMIADILAPEIDFFSIGTNDLIQYGSAVDRLNEKIADLYQPTHPGILRLIKQVVRAADDANVSVGVCGEMAGDPFLVPLLIGLGVRHLSVSAPLVPPVKYVIQKLEVPLAEALADQALSSRTSAEVMATCKQLVASVAPDLDA
jgi:phosphoenolpyruvate-protein phosphotransferase (PTS system enzyme I)